MSNGVIKRCVFLSILFSFLLTCLLSFYSHSSLTNDALVHIPLIKHHPRSTSHLVQNTHRFQGIPLHFTLYNHTSISTQSPFINTQLYGGITTLGEYYVRIHFGKSNSHSIHVQIDTGSSTLAVPLDSLSTHHPHLTTYSPLRTQNSSSRVIPCDDALRCRSDVCGRYNCEECSKNGACCVSNGCGFWLKYGDESGASGMLFEDEIRIESFKGIVEFGGVKEARGNFVRDGIGGILGLAKKELACNPTCIEPVWDALLRIENEKRMKHKNALMRDVFSICLTNRDGGVMSFGGFDKNMVREIPQYAEMNPQSPFYQVDMDHKLKVGQEWRQFTNRGNQRNLRAIVDSGTTLIVTSSTVFHQISAWIHRYVCNLDLKSNDIELNQYQNALCSQSWFLPAICVLIPDEILDRVLPPLVLTLVPNVQLILNPLDYMIPYRMKAKSASKQYRCVGFMVLDGISALGIDIILGNTLMIKYVTIYDRERNKIGFGIAQEECKREKNESQSSRACVEIGECGKCKEMDGKCSWNYFGEKEWQCESVDGRYQWWNAFRMFPKCHGWNCVCVQTSIPMLNQVIQSIPFISFISAVLIVSILLITLCIHWISLNSHQERSQYSEID